MSDFNIQRINELYKKSKTSGLTEEEKKEQAELRKAYVENFHNNMRASLDQMKIQYPDGTIENVKDRYKGEKNNG